MASPTSAGGSLQSSIATEGGEHEDQPLSPPLQEANEDPAPTAQDEAQFKTKAEPQSTAPSISIQKMAQAAFDTMKKQAAIVPNSKEDLIEKYYQYQKDRREIRRRNLQAQTNIAQYFRKHKLHIFPADPDRSQTSLREEYGHLLKKIEQLAAQKDQESRNFDAKLEEILTQKRLLQAEINRNLQDMITIKMAAIKNTYHPTTGKSITQKDVADQVRSLELLAEDMHPLRLQYAKLKKQYERAQDKMKAINNDQDEGIDAIEICLENQVYSERREQRREEVESLNRKISQDVVVLAHTKMKIGQITGNNNQMQESIQERSKVLNKMKEEETSLKASLQSWTKRADQLTDQIGLLNERDLLQEYSVMMK